jgi:hypothetical protein
LQIAAFTRNGIHLQRVAEKNQCDLADRRYVLTFFEKFAPCLIAIDLRFIAPLGGPLGLRRYPVPVVNADKIARGQI